MAMMIERGGQALLCSTRRAGEHKRLCGAGGKCSSSGERLTAANKLRAARAQTRRRTRNENANEKDHTRGPREF